MNMKDGRIRVVIESVSPEIDFGRFPAKRIIGDTMSVEADIFTDGHDAISASLLYKTEGEDAWREMPMTPLVNDRWQASFPLEQLGRYRYTVTGWVDHFKSWRKAIEKRVTARQVVSVDMLIGASMVEEAANHASGSAKSTLKKLAASLRSSSVKDDEKLAMVLEPDMVSLVDKHSVRLFTVTYPRELVVVVDPVCARFSAWYEMFPRSASSLPGRHGTFRDCERLLPRVAAMGFDILYFPPIHPIGVTHRKGRNNRPSSNPEDAGSPWAIGSSEGGHKSVNPMLGTPEDYKRLIAKARDKGIEIAFDLAYNCTPDHPYVKEHPEWFRKRPDGTIQYAENPPKKYEDIIPFDFETEHWSELWEELKSIVLFWIDQGIRIFRVDNPHTKPFPFWEWLITEVKRDYPEVIFLSEAFTRPKVMNRLTKLGFSQTYTYFAWRNTKWELTQYFTELGRPGVRDHLRPNLWPNTPDILTEYLQFGGRPAFIARLILAATLGASYGIYGAPYELMEARPREPGSEEYVDSEKYEIKHWNLERPDSLREFITRVNRIRRENPALHDDVSLRFHDVDNDSLLCYSKHTPDWSNIIVTIVNLDPHHTQAGWVTIPLETMSLDAAQPFQVHDLLSDARYLWHGPRNYVELNPNVVPAHVLRIRRRIRSERDFDYFM
ncbi:MAG: alpha-1,4-glucan--maltose-1-phosphate maltosyltransferase [Chloroflexota bacterium]